MSSTSRIGGPPPSEPGKGAQEVRQTAKPEEKKVREVEKVEEVSYEKPRKKFSSFMMEEEEEPETAPQAPSLFDLAAEEKPPLTEEGESAVPSPAYSPPPNVANPPPASEKTSPLPRSQQFWQEVDEPPDLPPTAPLQFKEITPSAIQGKKQIGKEEVKGKGVGKGEPLAAPLKKEKPIPAAATREKAEKKEESLAAPREIPLSFERRKEAAAKGKEEEAAPAMARPLEREEQQPPLPSAGPSPREERKEERALAPPPSPKERIAPVARGLKEREKRAPLPSSPLSAAKEREKKVVVSEEYVKKGEDRDREKKERVGEKEKAIEMQAPPPLPPQVVPLAQAATAHAAPYLSPEILPLFYQMVGTIYVMITPPGISRTEMVLNAPSFAHSKFFGATITIEKYATAPDSLNIRLSGSNEAVATFNQNLPSLIASFQTGNFPFRIGRLEAEYAFERPVFRRKEPKEEKKGFGEGFEGMKR